MTTEVREDTNLGNGERRVGVFSALIQSTLTLNHVQ